MKRTFGICAGIIAAGLLLAHSSGIAQSIKGNGRIGGNGGLRLVISSQCYKAFQGVSFSCTVSATGGAGGYTFAKVSGAFPLNIADVTGAGVIAGTPTVMTQGCEVVSVTDRKARVAQSNVCITPGSLASITVNPSGQQIATGQPLQMQAIGLWNVSSGTTTLDMTTLVTWTCPTAGNPGCGSVSASGLFTANSSTPGAADPTATFTGSGTVSGSVTVTVSSSAPTFQTTSLPNGQINQLYPENSGAGFQLVCNGGAGGPYTFALGTLTLPAGMSLSTAGVLSGTPSTSGTFNGTITCKDSALNTATSSFPTPSLTIASLNSPLAVGCSPSPACLTIPVGSQIQLTATATYSDSSTAIVTQSSGSTGGSPIRFVQAGNGLSSSGLNATAAPTSTVGAGDNVYLFCSQHADNTHNITASDPASQSYTQVGTNNTGYDAFNLANEWKFANSAAITSSSCTIAAGGAASTMTAILMELSGAAASGDIDGTPTTPACPSACTTSLASGSITTTNANDVLIYCVNVITDETFAAGPGYTIPTNEFNARSACQYQVVASPGTYSTSMSWNVGQAQAGGIFFAVKQASAGSGTSWSASGTSSGGTVCSVGQTTGLVQGLVAGTCTVTATLSGVSGSATVTVQGSTDTGLTISPAAANGAVGSSTTFTAKGNATGNDYTGVAAWSSSDSSVASLVSASKFTCNATSATPVTITATSGSIHGTGTLACTAAGASLLFGCTVSATNVPSCATPAGWTLVSAQGFETGSVSAGQSLFSGTSIACGFAHTGNCALKRFNNSGDQPTGMIQSGASINSRETYVSWWEYLDPQTRLNLQMITTRRAIFDASGNTLTDLLWNWEDGAAINGSPCYQNCTSAQSSMYAEGRGALPNFSKYDGSYPLIFGSWVQYEADLKTNDPGSSNGSFTIWRNGSLIQSVSSTNFNGSQDMALAQLEIGGYNEALVYYQDSAHTTCSPAQTLGQFTTNNTNWGACVCSAQCPPNGTIPTFNRYIDDVIVLKK